MVEFLVSVSETGFASIEVWAGIAFLGALAFVLGFALNYGSICTVIATRELVSEEETGAIHCDRRVRHLGSPYLCNPRGVPDHVAGLVATGLLCSRGHIVRDRPPCKRRMRVGSVGHSAMAIRSLRSRFSVYLQFCTLNPCWGFFRMNHR